MEIMISIIHKFTLSTFLKSGSKTTFLKSGENILEKEDILYKLLKSI
jgi:hypothetical protein